MTKKTKNIITIVSALLLIVLLSGIGLKIHSMKNSTSSKPVSNQTDTFNPSTFFADESNYTLTSNHDFIPMEISKWYCQELTKENFQQNNNQVLRLLDLIDLTNVTGANKTMLIFYFSSDYNLLKIESSSKTDPIIDMSLIDCCLIDFNDTTLRFFYKVNSDFIVFDDKNFTDTQCSVKTVNLNK